MAGAPPEEGARAWAQVLTPRWPQLPEWHPQFPSGVCCKQAPPETSGRKRKHLPKEQFPGLSVRGGGEPHPTSGAGLKVTPTPHSIPKQSGGTTLQSNACNTGSLQTGRDRTDTRPPQASNAERRPRPPGVTSQERRRQAQVAPPPVHPWTGNLCPWSSRAHVSGRPWCSSGEDVTF